MPFKTCVYVVLVWNKTRNNKIVGLRKIKADLKRVALWLQAKSLRHPGKNLTKCGKLLKRGGFRELMGLLLPVSSIYRIHIRSPAPVSTFTGAERSISSIDVHEQAPIMTSGPKAVNIWTTSGDFGSTLKISHGTNLKDRTLNYSSGISFHPRRMMVAMDYNQDGQINIYTYMV